MGMALPLLSHYYDPSMGSLHVEHSVIVTLCSTLQQWVNFYGSNDDGRTNAYTIVVAVSTGITCPCSNAIWHLPCHTVSSFTMYGLVK